MVGEHTCRPSENPRHPGHCACGRQIAAATAAEPVRSLGYEHEFIREAAKVAEARYGTPAPGFEIGVQRRLAMGEERYHNTFLSRDLIAEILEEAHDVGGWSVLKAQEILARRGEDEAAAWHLFEAVVHAASIDFHIRALRGSE